MVDGFAKFAERFGSFEDQFVIIGGTACAILLEGANLSARSTQDLDIVLIAELKTPEFGRAFWNYVREAGYKYRNKSTGAARFYRFESPKSREYPKMIELFSRRFDFVSPDDGATLTPIPMDDEVSSLSAIILNDAYYNLLAEGKVIVSGVPLLSNICLIPFKARAYLDLSARKLGGEAIDSGKIKKHRNDVFRLAQMISPNMTYGLSGEVADDMRAFLREAERMDVDLRALNVRGNKGRLIELLYRCYGL